MWVSVHNIQVPQGCDVQSQATDNTQPRLHFCSCQYVATTAWVLNAEIPIKVSIPSIKSLVWSKLLQGVSVKAHQWFGPLLKGRFCLIFISRVSVPLLLMTDLHFLPIFSMNYWVYPHTSSPIPSLTLSWYSWSSIYFDYSGILSLPSNNLLSHQFSHHSLIISPPLTSSPIFLNHFPGSVGSFVQLYLGNYKLLSCSSVAGKLLEGILRDRINLHPEGQVLFGIVTFLCGL